MTRFLIGVLVVTACASAPAPAPKVPDESHRVPVNQVMPPEASGDGGPAKEARKERREGREVQWR